MCVPFTFMHIYGFNPSSIASTSLFRSSAVAEVLSQCVYLCGSNILRMAFIRLFRCPVYKEEYLTEFAFM